LHTYRRDHTSDASGALPLGEGDDVESASCARTDSKMVDRDVMMKFDVAKNESNRPTDKTSEGDHAVTANRHPGLDERLKNLETHLAMRYGKFTLSATEVN
jgi:hypothetical protein